MGLLIELLMGCLFSSMMYILYSAYLDKKANWGVIKVLIIIVFNALLFHYGSFIIFELIPKISMEHSIMQVFKTVVMCIIMTLPFKGKFYKKTFLIVIMLFIIGITEQLALLSIAFFKGISIAEVVQLYLIEDIISATSIVYDALAVMLIKILRRKRNVIEKPPLLYILELLIPVISNVLFFVAIFVIDVSNLVTFTVFLLSVNIVTFFIYDKLEQDFIIIQKYEIQDQQYVLHEEYYEKVEQNQREIRTIKHNLKNQLIALKAVADSGDKSKADQAINELTQRLPQKK